MIIFPNCKINLGLQVLQKRSDGFHDLATIFYPAPLKDVLEIIPAPGQDLPQVYNYGLPVNGEPQNNLCFKAWQLLKKDFPELPAVQIHLLKNIPMGAGLGGGSADGACMLQLLNNKYHLGLSGQQLISYALQLGSDCPFFIVNKPCYATGRGEIMEPISLNLSGYILILADTGIHINTGWAFSNLSLNKSAKTNSIKENIALPLSEWKNKLVNDFEAPVFEHYPQIKSVKENLYNMGAVYASMSGSGGVVFGLFNKALNFTSGLPPNYTATRL